MYDLIIIGGGPAGYVSAERAGHQGLKVLLFEKKKMGGVCLNEGCIPTKALLYSAKILDQSAQSDKYGVYSDNLRFDFQKMMNRKTKVVRKLVAGVEAKMKQHQVEVLKQSANIIGKQGDDFEVESEGVRYFAKNLLIATGSEAFVPPIPGLESAGENVLTNREILELKEVPASLTIVGGGVIGMEFASLFNSLGSKVTVIEMLPEILGGMDAEISLMLREIYAKKGIDFHLESKVVKVEDNQVIFEKGDETQALEFDKILMSVGRRPVTSGFGLENLGVEIDRGGIKVNAQMQTNVPGVYAAGDITGFSMLAHTASREGEVAVNAICGIADEMNYNAVPGVVYTNPEAASVGETETSAETKGIQYKVAKLPMAFSGRFVAENEAGAGICKILLDENNVVIGVHMLGNPSGEIIFGAGMAISHSMHLDSLKKIIFPHPTVSEIIKETFFEF